MSSTFKPMLIDVVRGTTCPKCRGTKWDRDLDRLICCNCDWSYFPESAVTLDSDPEVQDMLGLSSTWREHVDEAYKDLLGVMTDGEAMIVVNAALAGLEREESLTNYREFHRRTQAAFVEFKARPALICEGCKRQRRVTEVRQTPKRPGQTVKEWDGGWHLLCPDCQAVEDVIIGVDVGIDGGGCVIVASTNGRTTTIHPSKPILPAEGMAKAAERVKKMAEAAGASMKDVARAMTAMGAAARDGGRALEWAMRVKDAEPELYERAISEARVTGDTLEVAYNRLKYNF